MEHARKMILLPEESVQRLRSMFTSHGLKSVQTPGTTTSRLDAEMNDILNSPSNADDREKWSRYNQVLQRYLHFKGASNENKKKADDSAKLHDKTIRNEDKEEEEDDEDVAEEERKREEEVRTDLAVVASVPERYQSRASRLVNFLRVVGNVEWDDSGEVTIGGVKIPNAKITTLVNDAVRDRKKKPPVGRSQFALALRSANIPREYIGNAKLWKLVAEDTVESPLSNDEPSPSKKRLTNSSPEKETLYEPTTSQGRSGRRRVAPLSDQVKSWRRLSGGPKK